MPAINYDAVNSEFEFGTFSASPSSSSMGDVQAGVAVRAGNLKPVGDNTHTLGDANERWADLFLGTGAVVNFNAGNVTLTHSDNTLTLLTDKVLAFGDAGESISGDGTRMTIASSENLQLKSGGYVYKFMEGTTERLNLTKDGSDHVKIQGEVSDKDIIFLVNDGGSPGTEVARIKAATSRLELKTSNEAGTNAGVITFATDGQEAIWGDGDRLRLKSGNALFAIPTSTGTSGQFLTTDGSGDLSFGSPGASIVKAVATISGSGVAAGTAYDFGNADAVIAGSSVIAGLAQSDAQGKSLDVFVNGQLLVSGSETEAVTNKERDYAITGASTIKFAFALEADDVVQVIKR